MLGYFAIISFLCSSFVLLPCASFSACDSFGWFMYICGVLGQLWTKPWLLRFEDWRLLQQSWMGIQTQLKAWFSSFQSTLRSTKWTTFIKCSHSRMEAQLLMLIPINRCWRFCHLLVIFTTCLTVSGAPARICFYSAFIH